MALGRHRALGAIGATYYLIRLMTGMNPVEWASSDPALKLGLTFVSGTMPEGLRPAWNAYYASHADKEALLASYIFSCAQDPATVQQLLLQDPRVQSLELIGGDSVDVVAVPAQPTFASESRPQPGQPELQYSGYIPKLPNDPQKALSINDIAMANMPVTMDVGVPPPVPSPSTGKIPLWVWLLGAYVATR